MGISLGSINTGLPKDIVKKIIDAEKIPIQRMQVRKEKIEEKKKLIRDLTELIQSLKKNLYNKIDEKLLVEFKIATDNDKINVNIDKNKASPANYRFEILKLAQKSSALSSGFDDPDNTYTGVGFIRYELSNGENKKIYVNSDHATLRGIAALINNNSEIGMKANVINDGSFSDKPWRLLLSLKETGKNSIAQFPYFYFVDGEEDLFLEKENPAQNAVIKIDGFEIESPSNKIKDIIPGVTIDLKEANPNKEFNLEINQDQEAISLKISDLIEKINNILSFVKEQNSLDENTDTSRTLGGDLILQTIESRLRNALFKNFPTSSGYRRIGDFGIIFQRDGLLRLDQKKFDSMLAKNYQTVSEFLVGQNLPNQKRINGFIKNMINVIEPLSQFPNGALVNRDRGFQQKINQINQRIETRERLIEQKETNLKNKFSKLEGLISKIQTQGAGIASLASLSPPQIK